MKNRAHVRQWFTLGNAFLVFIILCIFIFLQNTILFEAILEGDIQKIKRFVGDNRYAILLFSTFVMIIQNTFTIIPLLLVITINITFFGFLLGFLWSWFTSIIAAILIFFLARYLFQSWLLTKVQKKLVEKVEKKGFLYVFEARVFPFVPTSLVNILAGVSSIKFSSFLLGTLFGNFIYFFVLALIPAGIFSSPMNEYVLGGILLVFLSIYYVYSKRRSSKVYSTKTEKQKGQSN